MRLEAFDVCACFIDAFLEYLCMICVVPFVRRFVVADGDGVFEQIGRMDNKRQTVNTVATEQ